MTDKEYDKTYASIFWMVVTLQRLGFYVDCPGMPYIGVIGCILTKSTNELTIEGVTAFWERCHGS